MSDWMVIVNLVAHLLTWIVLIVGGLFLRSHLPAYFQEKGKNLATKEDIEIMTDRYSKTHVQRFMSR
jgi:hypothetical protein